MTTIVVPPWLEIHLKTKFFNDCPTHAGSHRSHCNMFCLDCDNVEAFCSYCRPSEHQDHHVLQILRSPIHNAVRASVINKAFNISDVQKYKSNGEGVVFLNKRPQLKSGGKAAAASHVCEICGWNLMHSSVLFCSLSCKFDGIKNDQDISKRAREETTLPSSSRKEALSGEGRSQENPQSAPPSNAARRRRRKQRNPRRAPFRS